MSSWESDTNVDDEDTWQNVRGNSPIDDIIAEFNNHKSKYLKIKLSTTTITTETIFPGFPGFVHVAKKGKPLNSSSILHKMPDRILLSVLCWTAGDRRMPGKLRRALGHISCELEEMLLNPHFINEELALLYNHRDCADSYTNGSELLLFRGIVSQFNTTSLMDVHHWFRKHFVDGRRDVLICSKNKDDQPKVSQLYKQLAEQIYHHGGIHVPVFQAQEEPILRDAYDHLVILSVPQRKSKQISTTKSTKSTKSTKKISSKPKQKKLGRIMFVASFGDTNSCDPGCYCASDTSFNLYAVIPGESEAVVIFLTDFGWGRGGHDGGTRNFSSASTKDISILAKGLGVSMSEVGIYVRSIILTANLEGNGWDNWSQISKSNKSGSACFFDINDRYSSHYYDAESDEDDDFFSEKDWECAKAKYVEEDWKTQEMEELEKKMFSINEINEAGIGTRKRMKTENIKLKNEYALAEKKLYKVVTIAQKKRKKQSRVDMYHNATTSFPNWKGAEQRSETTSSFSASNIDTRCGTLPSTLVLLSKITATQALNIQTLNSTLDGKEGSWQGRVLNAVKTTKPEYYIPPVYDDY